jgi:flagellar secretion chaperone FliS
LERMNQYRSYQAETAGPEERVVLLYDGARRFTDQALHALRSGNYEAVSLNTGKAQRILEEFLTTLNFDAGAIAENLAKLYEYWIWRLSQGLIHKDEASYAEVSAALVEMHDAWAEAAKKVRMDREARSVG